MNTGMRGGVDEVRGPFTYKIVETPVDPSIQRLSSLPLGPGKTLIQVDADGNEYTLAEISPLAAPGEAEMVAKALNQLERRRHRGSARARKHRS